MEPFFDHYQSVDAVPGQRRSPRTARSGSSRRRSGTVRRHDASASSVPLARRLPGLLGRTQTTSAPRRSSTPIASSSTRATTPRGPAGDPGRRRRGMALPHRLQLRRGLPARHQRHARHPRGDAGDQARPGAADRTGGRRWRLLIHTDGAARGNPGPAGAWSHPASTPRRGRRGRGAGQHLGVRTNNVAEWSAVELPPWWALAPGRDARGPAHGLGAGRSPDRGHLQGQASGSEADPREGHGAARQAGGVHVGHVPRALNTDADRLSNVAIDQPRDKGASGAEL